MRIFWLPWRPYGWSWLLGLVLMVVMVVSSSLYFSRGQQTALSGLIGRTVVLDPGHGADDPGAQANGVSEKDVDLAIARYLQNDLVQVGVRVLMTRHLDTDAFGDYQRKHVNRQELQKRVDMANASHADVFLSIHANSYPMASLHGAQIFVDKTSPQASRELARSLQKAFSELTPTTRSVNQGINHYLLKHVKIPSATVEVGFLSNPKEATLLATSAYQKKVAYALFLGLVRYFHKMKAIA